AWEAETLAALDSTEPVEWVWLDDDQDNGGQNIGDWNVIEKGSGPVFSGKTARRQSADKDEIVQHTFQNASRRLSVNDGDSLYAYVWIDPDAPPKAVMLQWNSGGWEHRAFWGDDVIEYGGIGEDAPSHRRIGDLPTPGEWARLEVDTQQVGLEAGNVANGMAFTQFGGTAYWDAAGVKTTRGGKTRSDNSKEVLAALAIKPSIRTEDQQNVVADHYRTISPKLSLIRDEMKTWQDKRAAVQQEVDYCLTTVAGPPRTIRILPRGNWMDDSGPIVTPNTPEFLTPMKGVNLRRATRLDLANWLVARDNPMTARAFVNRLWALYFGMGIAAVQDDLGSQGERPANQPLLDWLAVEFMDSGWNMKHVARLIVTSNTYRQSSHPIETLKEVDPYNRLLARQSSRRLQAEMIRDNALALGGYLVEKIGGPSVRPYQPAGYYANLNFPKREYVEDIGESQHRRGVYTHWQRTFPHPSLMAFDAPSRQECTAQRARSNTPTQALVLLNDPTYVEAAKGFAGRIIREGGKTPEERIAWAYEQALAREPRPNEAAVVSSVFEKHLAEYGADPTAASKVVAVGQSDAPADLDAVELAAWISVARVVLNLNESITRY
ncbi:MAG: DUF1553 domain-containing protein, partial [Candidatus Poribacteria bacterium]|nr:DUF1553 domain-containing protein [Candidatus Poribacteria bacterium]